MLQTRGELYGKAREMYRTLLTRTARRYDYEIPYVVSDSVGYSCTRIEELFRPMWGIAPFLRTGDLQISDKNGPCGADAFLRRIMLEGTAPDSPRRFDRDVTDFNRVEFANQSITEIAAWLVAAYFAPNALWEPLSDAERRQIADWVLKWAGTALRSSWPNNHYWYPIYCLEVLRRFGYSDDSLNEERKRGLEFLETFYIDNGWYSDGPFGRFDYYEAWAHHTYPLLWILLADPEDPEYEERCAGYRERSAAFLKFFLHYFDSDGGMAAYGRSIGYRFAAVAPFGLAALTGCDISLGAAKNVILKNISYFFERSIPTDDGVFPVGYLYESPGFGENYASDGAVSCYTEGFMCLLAGEEHPLWQAEPEPLPVEKDSYLLESPLPGMEILLEGDGNVNGVTLYNNSIHYYQDDFFGYRFNDMAGAYSKFAYNSRSGFGLSTADNVSSDNMISLITPDGAMISHRRRILNSRACSGVLASAHIPFSNDPASLIESWTVPVGGGFHLRVHRVTLSRPYIVREGGFSVGVRDDFYTAENGTVSWRDTRSSVRLSGDVKARLTVERIQPGMHLLQPQAMYPAWQTDVLAPGVYTFLTTVYFSTDGKLPPPPEVNLENGALRIFYRGNLREIQLF